MAKGTIIIRIEDTVGLDVRNNRISRVKSLSLPPFSPCTDFHAGQSDENPGEHSLGAVRAISVAATRPYDQVKRSSLVDNVIEDVDSEYYMVCGIDIQGDTSGVEISHNKIDLTGRGSKSKAPKGKHGSGSAGAMTGKSSKTEASKGQHGSSSADEDETSTDKYIGLRIRSHVDGHTIFIDDSNKISQAIVDLAPERRLRRDMFHGSPHGELEWVTGGCPFARRRVS